MESSSKLFRIKDERLMLLVVLLILLLLLLLLLMLLLLTPLPRFSLVGSSRSCCHHQSLALFSSFLIFISVDRQRGRGKKK